MNMREAFEAWAKKQWQTPAIHLETWSDGTYRYPSIQDEYISFCAGAAFAARECAEICHNTAQSLEAEMDIRAAFPEAFK